MSRKRLGISGLYTTKVMPSKILRPGMNPCLHPPSSTPVYSYAFGISQSWILKLYYCNIECIILVLYNVESCVFAGTWENTYRESSEKSRFIRQCWFKAQRYYIPWNIPSTTKNIKKLCLGPRWFAYAHETSQISAADCGCALETVTLKSVVSKGC